MEKKQTMELLRRYLDELLDGSSAEAPLWNIEQIREGKPNKWNYIDGCMITAVMAMYRITGEKKYLEFADRFMSGFVQPDGSIRTYSVEEYNLDNVSPGRNLFALYRETGDIYLVADVLGHKDVNTTRKHYAAIDEDRRRSASKYVKLREV